MPTPQKKKQKQEDHDWEGMFDDPQMPVVEVRPPSDGNVLDIASDSLFADMVAPVAPQVFLKSCFRKKALHIRYPNGIERVQPIINAMGNLDPSFILQETSSENIFCWILDQEQRKIQSVEIDNVDTAIALHKAGHATYCRAPPHVEQPMVANLLRGTGMGCGNYDPSGSNSSNMGRGEVEVFMGTCQHTTDWHYDFQENSSLQLSGVKKWTLQQGTVQHPLRGCTPHYQAPDVVESQLKAAHLSDANFQFGTPQVGVNAIGKAVEVIVKPGDLLYFPAGMWHKVETVEPGVSINVSLMATNYAALVTQALHHYLLTKDEWRQSVVSGTRTGCDTALDHMQKLLKQLPFEIEKLNSMNFAEQILPPVVRDPPRLELVVEEAEEEVEEEEVNENGQHTTVFADRDEAMVEVDGETVDDDEEDEDIVDIHNVETPGQRLASYNLPGKLVVNSLACLLPMSDITSFYSGNDDKENAATAPLYVLNINYAGNEMHESTVRAVLKDSNGILDKFVDGKPREFIACPTGVHEAWQECMLYYGFFVWIPNGTALD